MSGRASWRIAYDAQMGLWRWLRTDAGQQILALKYETESEKLDPRTRSLLRFMYANEEPRLLSADPIFVSTEMCELVEAAADPNLLPEPFKPEPLYVTDLPTACGFLYYERPFVIPNRFDEPVSIRGFSWTPMMSMRTAEELDGDPEAVFRHWREKQAVEGDGAGIAIALYSDLEPRHAAMLRERGNTPPTLDVMHVTPWYFGMSLDGNELDLDGKPTGAAWWWRIAQVTLRLMQQKISAKQSVRAERPQRREAKRLRFPERETLVVRLRREKKEPTSDETGPARYSHRFIVNGFWRNHWYPKSQEHRQIWISPYVKGDESLPLIIKPRRALVWSR